MTDRFLLVLARELWADPTLVREPSAFDMLAKARELRRRFLDQAIEADEVRAERNELRGLAQALVDALPICATDDCGRPATHADANLDDMDFGWCDEHEPARYVGGDLKHADELRALLKKLEEKR